MIHVIHMYAKRLLLPFVGVAQIAELGPARALSLDGAYWSIQYRLPADPQRQTPTHRADLRSAHTRIVGYHYTAVGIIREGRLEHHPVLHPALDAVAVRAAGHRLFEAVTTAHLPFAASDRYEYWLLDARDQIPLALLQTGVDAPESAPPPRDPEWHPMPAADLKVQPPEPPQAFYVPPVNARLESAVAERAGRRPQARWFERTNPTEGDFPPCLIREDWPDAQHQVLCDRYLNRLAPRLLMLQGLPHPVRHRLEHAAREFAFDIERFYPLYPDVVDQRLLTAARVEARLRRSQS